jgi:hypothetical protein
MDRDRRPLSHWTSRFTSRRKSRVRNGPSRVTRITGHESRVTTRRPRGIALAWTVLVLFAMIGLVGLSIDWGWVALAAHQLQNGADAAALAGAQALSDGPDEARAAAVFLGSQNLCARVPIQLGPNPSNDPAGDVVLGRYDLADRSFTADESGANAVKVSAPRIGGAGVSLFFGPIFGLQRADVVREAIAMVQARKTGPGIIMLDTSGLALQISGNGHIQVNGTIAVNSAERSYAFQYSGGGSLSADSFEIVGGAQLGSGSVDGAVHTGVEPASDPFAHLSEPDPTGVVLRSSSKYTPTSGSTLYPGRYVGGISISNSGTYNFEPGIYYIQGGGFKISSTCTVNLNGVLIYNSHDNGSNGDQVLISGDATINWTPLDDPSSPYDGMSIFQSSHSAMNGKKIEISGNGKTQIFGNVYGKTAEVQLSGNGPSDVLGGGFVVGKMQISGDGSFNVGIGGGGAGSGRVLLVK